MKSLQRAFTLLAALTLAPAAAFCSSSALGLSAPMNRLVTPNGDRLNDTFIFRCHNPRDAQVEGKIYDFSGREVGKLTLKRRDNGDPSVRVDSGAYYDLEWDPNAGGKAPGGVYIYQVLVETKVYKGTVIVIR